MGIGALFEAVGVVTGGTVNDGTSAVHLVIAHAAHGRCLPIRIVAGFAYGLLFSSVWDVNAEHPTFTGEVVTVSTRHNISGIMGGLLGLDGDRK
jgi:hypothetical protein